MEPEDPISRRVVELLAQYSGREASSIQLSDPLSEFDSLDIVQLVILFEDEFGLDFPDPEPNEMKTVGDLVEWIRRHR